MPGVQMPRVRHPFPKPIIPDDEDLSPEEVQIIQQKLMKSIADGTLTLYEKHWDYFVQWARDNNHTALPASPGVVASYLSSQDHMAPSTLKTAAAAIRKAHLNAGHPLPTMHPLVSGTLSSIEKNPARAPQQATGLTHDLFLTIKKKAYKPKDGETPFQTNRRAATDIGLIAFMRDTLCRRSETAAVRWQDIHEEPDGTATLHIPFSKTDQTGKGADAYLSTETQVLLIEMVESRGRRPKPTDKIFRIGERQISNRIKAAAEHAGLTGNFSGHSPRVGMAQDLAQADFETVSIAQSGRWQSADTVVKYTKRTAAGKNAVARWYEMVREKQE